MHRITYRTPFFSSLGSLGGGVLLIALGIYALLPGSGFRIRRFVIPDWVVTTGGIIFVLLGGFLVFTVVQAMVAGKREIIIDQNGITTPKSDSSRKTIEIPRNQIISIHEKADDDDVNVIIAHDGGTVTLQRSRFKTMDDYDTFLNSVRAMSRAAGQGGYPTA